MKEYFNLLFILYLIMVNLISFIIFWRDKRLAEQRSIRIPESVLMMSVLVGGGLGATASMYLFRHKTRKTKFVFGIPLIVVLQLLLFFAIN